MTIGIDARMYGSIHQQGIGRYVQELLRQLLEFPISNYILFLSKEGMEMIPDLPHVQKIFAPFRWYTFAEQLHMPRLIRYAKVDIMHFPHFNVPYFCPVPYVITLHDLILLHTNRARATTLGPLLYPIKFAAWKFLLRHTLRKAQHIIVPSYAVKDELMAYMPLTSKKTSVIYEGTPDVNSKLQMTNDKQIPISNIQIPNQKLQATSYKLPPAPYILYVGSAYPHKNLERLVQAFALLTQVQIKSQTTNPNFQTITNYQLPNYKLVLVGKEDYF